MIRSIAGVSLNALLDLAGLQEGVTTLTLVADDGATVDVDLAEVRACEDCILSFRTKGGFRSVMPGFSGQAQIRGVIELQVK